MNLTRMYSSFLSFRVLQSFFVFALFISFTFRFNPVQAQKKSKFCPHEIGIGLEAGASFLSYTSNIVSLKLLSNLGGGAGFSYAFFFMDDLCISTGINIDLYTATIELPYHFSRSYDAISKGALFPNSYFTFTYTLSGYKETQQALYLSVPLMLQFQTWWKYKFFAAFGFKVAVPVYASYSADSYRLSTTGYFHLEDCTYDNIPQYGFGRYNPVSNGKLNMKSVLFFSLEYGLKIPIKNNQSLYIGYYLDYSIVRGMQNSSENPFYEYTGTDKGPNGLLNSKIDGKPIMTDIRPLAFGAKVKYVLGFKDLKKKRRK